MRPTPSLAPVVLSFASAVLLAALVLLGPDLVLASEKSPNASTCTCPDAQTPGKAKPWHRPKFADAKPILDDSDEVATLEAVHLALTEVGDGASYVWYRRNGRLSGVVQPTTSFKDGDGRICRHVVLVLSAGPHTRKAEGVACRLTNGSWQLEG